MSTPLESRLTRKRAGLSLGAGLAALGLIFGIFFLLPVPVVLADGPAPALVIVPGDYSDLQIVRQEIVRAGGQVDHIFPPSALIARLTPEQAAAVRRAPQAALVSFDRVTPSASLKNVPQIRLPIEIWNSVYHDAPMGPQEGMEPFFDEVLPSPAHPQDPRWGELAAPGPGPYDTSLYMLGDVIVAYVLPESTGVAEPSTEDWTASEIANVQNASVAGMNVWAQAAPTPGVTFIHVWADSPPPGGLSYTVACDYEAESHSNFDSAVINSFMARLGYTSTSYSTNIYNYLNALRRQYKADWAYMVQMRDDTNSCGRASAYLGGPATTLFDCDLRSGMVLAHESGHIFMADDEYCPDACVSPVVRSGALQVVNANSAGPSGAGGPGFFSGKGEGISNIMLDTSTKINPYTRGQVGWRDNDGDGILDLFDSYPNTTLFTPTVGAAVAVTGQAVIVPVLAAGNDTSLDELAGVEVRLNGSTWMPAAAKDGNFSSLTETFSLTWPLLPNGVYTVEARAYNRAGNVERSAARTVFTVTGSPAVNAAPFSSLKITPGRADLTTGFTLDARDSADLEGSALQARWDWENDGQWDTAFDGALVVTHTYSVSGTYRAAVEVRDSEGASSIATGTLQAVSGNTPPTAYFSVREGDARFGTINPIFEVDPHGSTDAETAPANLEYRWDWDDNGTWDTSWMTGPLTASKVYTLTAMGRGDGLPRSNHWNIRLMVRDSGGLTATIAHRVWANPYNHAPTLQRLFVTPSAYTTQPLPFDPEGTGDPDLKETWDNVLEYRFDWESDGNWDTEWVPFASTASYRLTTPGIYSVTAQVRDLYGASDTLSQTIAILLPPDVSVSPAALTAAALPGQQVQRVVSFTNAGAYTGSFDLKEVALGITSSYTVTDSRSGSLSYRWISADNGGVTPRAGEWVATAAPRDADDEGYVGPIPLKFPFPFYGQIYTQVYLNANGYLAFAPPAADFGSGTIPTTTLPNGMISAFWSDLNLGLIATRVPTDGYGTVRYLTNGPDGALVVVYQGAETRGHMDWSGNTFEVILRPDGTILLQYSYIFDTPLSPLGIEGPDGSQGLVYSSPLSNSLAVAFIPEQTDIPWLTLSALTGTVPAGDPTSVVVTFDAGGLAPGTYAGRLLVHTNDPETPFTNLPVTFTVGAPAYQLDLSPEAATLTAYAGLTTTAVVSVTNTGNFTDTFDLLVSDSAWPITLIPTATAALAPGARTLVHVQVAVPESASGQSQVFTVTGRSRAASQVTDTAILTVNATPMHRIWLPLVLRDE